MSHCAYKELAGLWVAVFGEKPAVVADPGLTAQILVAHLPPAEPYSFDGEASMAPSGEAEPRTPLIPAKAGTQAGSGMWARRFDR